MTAAPVATALFNKLAVPAATANPVSSRKLVALVGALSGLN